MPETTPLIKAALNLRGGAGFDVYLRILACFCIILLHVSAEAWYNVEIYSIQWVGYQIVNSISRLGVDVFIMISGALFLGNDRGSSIQKIKKYICKIVCLICVWSVGYFTLRFAVGDIIIRSVSDIFNGILNGYYHLWYLWTVLGLYLISPILKKFVVDKKICEYFLILCMVVCWIPEFLSIIPSWNKFLKIIFEEKMNFYMPMGYIGCYVLGYYLYQFGLCEKKIRILVGLGFLGAIYGSIGGILYSRYIGKATQVTFNNLTISTVCYSAMVFFIFYKKFSCIKFSEKAKNIIYQVGNSTLGIYLIHVLLVKLISDNVLLKMNYRYPIVSIPLSACIFVISFGVIKFMKKIPIVGKWLI